MRPKTKSFLVAAILALLASLVALLPLSPSGDPLYSLFLGFRKPLAALREPLILELPEGSTLAPARLGLALESLAEFGSGPVLVDLPLDWSASDAAAAAALSLRNLRDAIDTEFALQADNLSAFWKGLRSGSLRPSDAEASYNALFEGLSASRRRLVDLGTPLSEELPSLVGALSLTTRTWMALRLEGQAPEPSRDEVSSLDSLAARLTGTPVEPSYRLPEAAGLPALPAGLAKAVAGFGWSARIDEEGGLGAYFPLGAFHPLATLEGRILPHAALLLLAGRLGATEILLGREGIELVGARVPRSMGSGLFIPLDAEGRALFDRKAASGGETRRLAFSRVEDYRRAESSLLSALRAIEKAGYLVERPAPSLEWNRAELLASRLLSGQGGDPGSGLASLREAKKAWLEACEAALTEKDRIDELCAGLLATPGLTAQSRAGVETLRDGADRAFGAASTALATLREQSRTLSDELGASLVIIGEEARRSRAGFVPAAGAPPFDPTGGLADFLRAGLSGRFIVVASPFWGLGLAAGAGLLLSLALLFARARTALALGLLLATAFAAMSALALVEKGLWLSPLAPILSSLLPGCLASLRAAWGARVG